MRTSVGVIFSGAVFCLYSFCSILAAAGEELALTWENIFLNDSGVRDVDVSPDGKWLAVTTFGTAPEGIYLVSWSGSEATFWTEGSSPSWSPDSQRIIFSLQGDLWTVAVGSTESRRLTNDDHDERAPVFSPDGSLIAFYSTRSGHQDIWLMDSGGRDEVRQLTEAAMPKDDPRFSPSWSPDGSRIVYVSNQADYWMDDIWMVDVATKQTRRISSSLMAASTPAWSPEGDLIALLGTSKSEYWYEDLAYIYLLSPEAGTETIVEMPVYASDSVFRHPVRWSGDGQHLFFLYMERGDYNLWSVPSSGGVATRVTNLRGAIQVFDADGKAEKFAFVRSTPLRGSDVDVIGQQGGLSERRTHFARDFRDVQEPDEISFRSFDGLYIQGFLYRPPDFDATRKYPALVNVHGGGTNSYLRRQNLVEQFLAQRGYLVLAINYRGGSGFGRAFQDLSINDWANGQAHDAVAAAEYLRALPTSTGKVGIYGYSYGGITSMAAIARWPKAFDAAVPMAGIYDFGDAYQNADRLGKIFTRTGHGGSPEERPEVYARSNTLARIRNIQTPLLIMHGELDVRAPFRQYQLAVASLREHKKVFESKTYPGEPHGFRDPQNRVDMYRRLQRFFDARLQ